MLFLEQVANHVRLLLPTMQTTAYGVAHLCFSGRPTPAERIVHDPSGEMTYVADFANIIFVDRKTSPSNCHAPAPVVPYP